MILPRYFTERVYLPTETLSSMYDPKGAFVAKVLEQQWNDNKRDDPTTKEIEASCIPEGIHVFEKQLAGTFGRDYGYFRARAIEGRTLNQWAIDKNGNAMSSILIHHATYVHHLLGCLGVGGRFVDLNKDGVPDIVDSQKKLKWMYDNMPDVFELEIRKKR